MMDGLRWMLKLYVNNWAITKRVGICPSGTYY